jgi:formylglycine-generating enzyme required for sulfatase activity
MRSLVSSVVATATLLIGVVAAQAPPGPTQGAASRPATRTDTRGISWVRLPAGTFLMGCVPADEACERDERPRHVVEITRPLWTQVTEV